MQLGKFKVGVVPFPGLVGVAVWKPVRGLDLHHEVWLHLLLFAIYVEWET